jgi:hypothetical protein
MRPPSAERPGRLCCQDERRFGRWPMQRQRRTLTGVKPVGAVQSGVENFYRVHLDLWYAVPPMTGGDHYGEFTVH